MAFCFEGIELRDILSQQCEIEFNGCIRKKA